jgi:FkbM family methyltransferase
VSGLARLLPGRGGRVRRWSHALRSDRPSSHANWDDADPRTNGELWLINGYARQWNTVLDIGANTGSYARRVLAANPQCEVICFEPIPSLASALAADPRFSTYPYAVGDKATTVELHVNRRQPSNSSLWRRSDDTSPIAVTQVTLEEFVRERDIPVIDFTKIDTEGNELRVLQGARELVEAKRLRMLQFEYGGTYLDAGTSLKDVFELLSPHYLICHLLPEGLFPLPYSEALETQRYSNWVAFARDWSAGATGLRTG